MKKVIFITSCCVLLMLFTLYAQPKTEQFTVENYYKVKWGHADEFISLWKVNHYPLLKKAIEKELPADIPHVFISSITNKGILELKDLLWKVLNEPVS